jgi:hypothetical protein
MALRVFTEPQQVVDKSGRYGDPGTERGYLQTLDVSCRTFGQPIG